jgi:hypothetical protein
MLPDWYWPHNLGRCPPWLRPFGLGFYGFLRRIVLGALPVYLVCLSILKIMDPNTYLLLGGIVFAAINDPGPTAIYPQWAAPPTVRMIDATFLHDKNYFLSYKNIERACFRMFNANVKHYLINHLISTMLSGQCFVFLFRRLTERPHQGVDMNNPTSTSRR